MILGLPVSINPLQTIEFDSSQIVPLAELPSLTGQPVKVAGYRLLGWTGSEGFYLGDGRTFVWARGSEQLKTPPLWQSVLVQGRWRSDTFGTAWLQVEQMT